MKKRLLTTTIGICLCLIVNAQNDIDAIRYSFKEVGGNARTQSMGGAIGALGSDISVMGINPAGLALSRKSEFSMSLGFRNLKTNAEYINGLNTEQKFNFNIPNIGFKLTTINTSKGKPVKDGWSSFTFGMNVNRTNNFNVNSYYEGNNKENSITDFFTQHNATSGTHPFDYDRETEPLRYLAFNSFLVDYDATNDKFSPSILSSNRDVAQIGTISKKGNTNEYNMAFGANHSNKIYLGLGFNLQSVSHGLEKSFTEINNGPDSILDMSALEYTQNIKTTGVGAGLNLGIIFRPVDFLRFGISYQSPRVLHLKDRFDFGIKSEFDLNAVDPYTDVPKEKYSDEEKGFEYTYKVITPSRVTGSIALQYKKIGMLTADVEMVDYTTTRMEKKESNDPGFALENRALKDNYRQVMNYRIGGELNSGMYRFRAGYSYQASPYKDNTVPFNEKLARKSLSFGIGLADKDYNLDIGYTMSKWADYSSPYSLNDQETYFVTNNRKAGLLQLTLGLNL
jgi:long-subunit fatty acid transport protein